MCYTADMKQKNTVKFIFRIFLAIGIFLTAVTILVLVFAKDLFPVFIVGFQAVIWLSIGSVGLLTIRKKQLRREELLANGRRVIADVTDIYLDRRFQVNGRHPFRIACQYVDEGAKIIHTFQSEELWFDPRPLMVDDQVEVCIDGYDFRHYAVNTQKLLNGYTVE